MVGDEPPEEIAEEHAEPDGKGEEGEGGRGKRMEHTAETGRYERKEKKLHRFRGPDHAGEQEHGHVERHARAA